MTPSHRTYWLLSLGFAIALSLSLLLPIGVVLLLVLLYDLGILTAAVVDARRVQGHRVTVSRELLPRLSIGRDNPVTLTVRAADRPAEIRISDRAPTGMARSTNILTATLSAQTVQELSYTVHPTQRGDYDWGEISVRQLGLWQLGWATWAIAQPQTVSVYPDLIGLKALSVKLALQSVGVMRQRQRGMGTEFAELRDYATGDDPRLIDWKATARSSRPLVRVLEPEQEQSVIVLLDRGRLMTAYVQGLQRFDWGLNAALALAMTALKRGDRVGVAVFDRTIHTWLAPERGAHQLSHLMERLTPIQPELLEPDYFGAVSAVVNQQPRRALVVMITDIIDVTASAELLAAMKHLTPRYLPLCVTLRDPDIDQQAKTFVADPANAYRRTVALDLLAQRQEAFAKLTQTSALVLDAPANQISDSLVDRYLMLKARNRL